MRLQIYRGLIFTADHSASAGAGSFPAMPALSAARPLSGRTWKQHQHAAAEAGLGSALLVAPTGSGKTEAALLWVERQMSQRPAARIFYTLPYQASMNAMVARLLRDYFSPDERAPLQLTDDANQVVTIQHSRALLKFYQDMLEAEQTDSGRTPRQRTEEAKRRKNLARLNYYPVQVFSPYQMLKAAYSLKGYEALLVDYADALFVFDEIHAYDPKRLALIIGLMGWLAEHLRARFLIMTATLPPLIAEALDAAIPHLGRIQASDEDFRASQRHRAFIRQGHLLGNIVAAVSEDIAAGRSVLVCCNRVADAQAAYHLLRQLPQLTAGDTLLMLHGRFNGRDRAEKERRILESVGVGNPKRTPFVLVATQVVEVSLNVDFDTLYTDPAPLEALLQRFGRVNRGRGHSPLHPVYVFEQPNDPSAKSPYAPYAADLVLAGLEVLRERDGQPIDESLVSDMLSSIYHGEIAERWRGEYQASLHEFQAAILGKMQPFMSADKALQDSFYSMFDGVQVVPTDCLDAYQDALEEGRFLEASAYTVNISWGQYHQCFQRGLILKPDSEREFYPHIDVPYSSETGLDIAAAVQQKDEAE